MGEVKRIFNQAKIDRDTDARMVQPGSHRDALNVNIGESEGGDVGAVENLKGNEEISGQTSIEGATIGSVRDPNNNKVYWFTKGTTTDAIYEYNESTGGISTILKDKVGRDKIKPKCAPDLVFVLDEVADDPNSRPNPNITFTTPVGGCTITGQFNYDANAEYNDGTCIPVINGCTDANANNYNSSANTDNGSCTYTVLGCTDVNANNYDSAANTNDGSCTYTSTIGVAISGDGSFPNSNSPVTLTANVTNTNGTVTYLWNTGETTSTISISGSNSTITGNSPGVTVTDSYGSATDNYSVNFYTPTVTTYTKTLIVNTSGVSGMSNGQVTGNVSNTQRTGTLNQPWSFSTGIQANTGFSYSGTTPIAQSGTHTNNSSVTTTFTGAITANAPNTCTANLTSVVNGVTNGAINASYFTLTSPSSSAAVTCTNSLNALTVFPVAYALTSAGTQAGYSYAPATSTYTGNGGTYGTSSAVVGTANGVVTFTAPTWTLNASSSGSVGSNITVGGQGITNQVGDENVAESVSYTPTLSLASNYRWVSAPTISVSGLPSGVTQSAVSGVSAGGTGNASVTISGNWTPIQNVTITAVWSGGVAEAIPQRRTQSISSYGGVTTSAQCASRSTPITVYFSDTTSPYTGIRNGDTLYTTATGSGTFSSGSGYKTNVADGYGSGPGTITVSNGVVSNSNTSFC